MFGRFSTCGFVGGPRGIVSREKHRRAHRTDRNRSRFRLEGLEDRRLLSITEFPLPPNGGTSLLGIASGPDGNLWFGLESGYIGMISPADHSISEFRLSSGRKLVAGSDGNLWFTGDQSTSFGVLNPTTHTASYVNLPPGQGGADGISSGPDGNIWFSAGPGNLLGRINPTTHAISEFTLPSGHAPGYTTPGPDGNVWFAEDVAQIGMINPTTSVISEFPISHSVRFITAGPDGNIWFTSDDAAMVGMIDVTTHAVSEFSAPADPYGITSGPDGNLWFANHDYIGTINPVTHAITEYPVPYANSGTWEITTGPDGNLWFTDYQTNAIGKFELNTAHFVMTQQPPTSVTAGSPFGVTVRAVDSSGNLVTSFNGTVTAALLANPGGTGLGGTVTVTASGGVATFPGLTMTKAASGYSLQVFGSGVDSAATSTFTVTPATANKVVITQQPPATVKVKKAFGLQASIEDQYGNVVTTASNTVKVAFANNSTGATLGGTLSVAASKGVATFSNLTISKTGVGYTLLLSSSGLSSAVTNPFNVTKSGNRVASISASAAGAAIDTLWGPLVLDGMGFQDRPGLKKRARSS